ncbi:isoprenylcysteine carboxylmethyltransferase family protein [Puia sp.]|jgi:protein-S-isoprenylcysteine O-methyltransferase Ste14|uniref:methyltransferase family protein n=1 Tax=Puia sp. TaxID=2045100 RepID=UPI002F41843A
MENKKHPGVYVPPPLIYAAFFFLSHLLQKQWPLPNSWQETIAARAAAWIMFVLCFLILFAALRRFAASKNTLVTVRPASSLQTTGIYAITRNPMYLGLLLLYDGVAIFKGNAWTMLLLPLLMITIQQVVIRKEEQYLQEAFGEDYETFRKKVRRWI